MKHKTKLTLEELTKNNIWTVTSSELSQMIINGKKRREEFVDNERHYMNIIRTVFDLQYLKKEDTDVVEALEKTGYEIFSTTEDNGNNAIAIRKRPIKKVTDLTMENIQHLEAWEVLDLIAHNMGTGWKGLPLPIQDIIETAFFVDCTVMPVNTMRKKGGIIDKRKEDGYEVLEIERGTWIEGIFMKMKPKVEKVHFNYAIDDTEESRRKSKKGVSEEGDEIYDDDIELEDENDEELNDEELKMLDRNEDDELDEDEEVDENNIQLEDIDNIDDIADEDDA